MINLGEYYFVNLFFNDDDKLSNFTNDLFEYNKFNSNNEISFIWDRETVEFWQIKDKSKNISILDEQIGSIIEILQKFETEKIMLYKQSFVKNFKDRLKTNLNNVLSLCDSDMKYLQNMKITVSLDSTGKLLSINDIKITSPELLNGALPAPEKKERQNYSNITFVERLPVPLKDIDKFSIKYNTKVMEFRYNAETKKFRTLDGQHENESYIQMFKKFHNITDSNFALNPYSKTLVHTKVGTELDLIEPKVIIEQRNKQTIKEQILTTQLSTIDTETAQIHNENNTKDIDD